MTLWGCWLSESPFKVVSINRERNSGPTDISLIVFYKTWFYSLYLTSMGWVLAVKMCFKLNPELSLLFFPFLFMAPKRKQIIDFQWWCDMFTPSWYFKKRQKSLWNLFLLLGSRECTHRECQVLILSREEGEKKLVFFFPLYACLQSSYQRGKERPEG